MSVQTILTRREYEVLKYIVLGYTNKTIAEKLVVTVSTVKAHISKIYSKLKVHSRVDAALKAEAMGLYPNPHQDSEQP